MLLLTTPLHAQQPVVAEAYRTVNVRSGPGTQYPTIDQINSGEVVEISGRNDEESNWLRVEIDGQVGWIAFFTVGVVGDHTSLPIVAEFTPTATPEIVSESVQENGLDSVSPQVTAIRAVNVRSSPSIASARIGVLDPQVSAPITGKTADLEWLRVDFAGQEGWIAFFVVTVAGDLDSVAVIVPSPAQPTEEVQVSASTVEVTTRFNANLRQSPNRVSDLVVTVPYNTRLQAVARTQSSDWLFVEYEGQYGWLVTSLVVSPSGTDLNQLSISAS